MYVSTNDKKFCNKLCNCPNNSPYRKIISKDKTRVKRVNVAKPRCPRHWWMFSEKKLNENSAKLHNHDLIYLNITIHFRQHLDDNEFNDFFHRLKRSRPLKRVGLQYISVCHDENDEHVLHFVGAVPTFNTRVRKTIRDGLQTLHNRFCGTTTKKRHISVAKLKKPPEAFLRYLLFRQKKKCSWAMPWGYFCKKPVRSSRGWGKYESTDKKLSTKKSGGRDLKISEDRPQNPPIGMISSLDRDMLSHEFHQHLADIEPSSALRVAHRLETTKVPHGTVVHHMNEYDRHCSTVSSHCLVHQYQGLGFSTNPNLMNQTAVGLGTVWRPLDTKTTPHPTVDPSLCMASSCSYSKSEESP